MEGLALEPVKVGLPETGALEVVLSLAERAGAVAIGPGLGRGPAAQELVRGVLEHVTCPVVVDADGLFGFEPHERTGATVLTPHAGELARLLGVEAAWVSAHRLEAVSLCAERYGAVTLLKGADTLVQVPGQGVLVCDSGRPSLATAGTGDVLTGNRGCLSREGDGAGSCRGGCGGCPWLRLGALPAARACRLGSDRRPAPRPRLKSRRCGAFDRTHPFFRSRA